MYSQNLEINQRRNDSSLTAPNINSGIFHSCFFCCCSLVEFSNRYSNDTYYTCKLHLFSGKYKWIYYSTSVTNRLRFYEALLFAWRFVTSLFSVLQHQRCHRIFQTVGVLFHYYYFLFLFFWYWILSARSVGSFMVIAVIEL